MKFKGVFFNPKIDYDNQTNCPFPTDHLYGGNYRQEMCTNLKELSEKGLNFICIFVPVYCTLNQYGRGNKAGQFIAEWANFVYLDNLVLFLEDCYRFGISVEMDLVDNRWIPATLDSDNHIFRKDDRWPVGDDQSAEASAEWYSQVIMYIEERVAFPQSIAMWCMLGNYQLGCSEPVIWDDYPSEVLKTSEIFVKKVWPVFTSSGNRPKASPIMLPMFSSNGYWSAKLPHQRLSAFSNLKKWLVDDLNLPPDYWIMTTYAYCDPAPDGYYYLKSMVDILSEGNDAPIISTDLKCVPGHQHEIKDSIVYDKDMDFPDMMEWHLKKCSEYGFAGFWIWALQDNDQHKCGIRNIDKSWKNDIIEIIRKF